MSDPSIKIQIEIQNIHENENPIRNSLGLASRLESKRGYQIFLW